MRNSILLLQTKIHVCILSNLGLLLFIIYPTCRINAQFIKFEYGSSGNMTSKEYKIEPKDFTIEGSHEVCKGEITILTTSNDESAQWSNGESNSSIAILINSDSIITATLLNSYGCTFTQDFNITALDLPAKPIIERHGDSLIVYNVTGEFTWYKNNVIFSAGSNYVRTNQLGSFTVSVTNNDGCSSISAPFLITSTVDVKLSKLQIYPNPAHDFIQIIDIEKFDPLKIQISNNLGFDSKTYSGTSVNNMLDIDDLLPGYYLLTITTRQHHIINSSFVKF